MTEIEPVAPDALPAVTRRRDENPYWIYLARFRGESERTMRRCLDRIAALLLDRPPATAAHGLGEMIPWENMRYAHVLKLRNRFEDNWESLSHVNKHMSALRGVLRECWRANLMSAEDFRLALDVENVTGSREPTGRSIHADEFASLLAVCLSDERGPLGTRDAALVATLQSTGIRRSEAAGALIERYDHGERSLRVIGKGNKERTVYLHPTAIPYVDRWLVAVGARRGPFFRRVDKWENITAKPLASRTIGYIVNERREAAGLPPMSTHDFRRTFIGDFIDAGGDLVQAQKLAGHASATTTAGYDRRPGRALRTAVDRLKLPSPEELTKHNAKGN
jgi:site-specific recombinase XerD